MTKNLLMGSAGKGKKMDNKDFSALADWFSGYVKGYYSSDKDMQHHVRLKEEHTQRVCELSRSMGRSLALTTAEMLVADTAALFHDVGRFEQYKRYRTFNDMRSLDHAALAVEILRENRVLADLSAVEQEGVEKAIFHHNKRELPHGESGAWLLYGKMVRDADKLDIFELIVNKDMIASPEIQDSYEYSRGLAEMILAGRMPQYEEIRSAGDQMLFRASWVYGMYFPYTCGYMLEKRYVEQMLAFLPDDDVIKAIKSHLLSCLRLAAAKKESRM